MLMLMMDWAALISFHITTILAHKYRRLLHVWIQRSPGVLETRGHRSSPTLTLLWPLRWNKTWKCARDYGPGCDLKGLYLDQNMRLPALLTSAPVAYSERGARLPLMRTLPDFIHLHTETITWNKPMSQSTLQAIFYNCHFDKDQTFFYF